MDEEPRLTRDRPRPVGLSLCDVPRPTSRRSEDGRTQASHAIGYSRNTNEVLQRARTIQTALLETRLAEMRLAVSPDPLAREGSLQARKALRDGLAALERLV